MEHRTSQVQDRHQQAGCQNQCQSESIRHRHLTTTTLPKRLRQGWAFSYSSCATQILTQNRYTKENQNFVYSVPFKNHDRIDVNCKRSHVPVANVDWLTCCLQLALEDTVFILTIRAVLFQWFITRVIVLGSISTITNIKYLSEKKILNACRKFNVKQTNW